MYFNNNPDTPFHSTNYPSEYQVWLTKAPDFTGFLKERNTGAKSIADLAPGLPDIDTFVDGLRTQAALTITGPTDVPCGAGRTVSFANASTLKIVQAVEIDVRVLEACDGAGGPPKILYSTVPLRLVNGEQLDAGLTVANTTAVYVKGNFNTVSPKPAAVVSGNRVYHVSSTFRDYTQFITPARNKTLADTVYAFTKDQSGYDSYRTKYNTAITLPPYAHWLPVYAGDVNNNFAVDPGETTSQRMAVVTPRGEADFDQNITTRAGLLEDWSYLTGHPVYEAKPGGEYTKFTIQRIGVFIHLVDNNPKFLVDGVTPTDYLARTSSGTPLADWDNVYGTPIREVRYDATLVDNAPPGFSKGSGGGSGKQVLWMTQ